MRRLTFARSAANPLNCSAIQRGQSLYPGLAARDQIFGFHLSRPLVRIATPGAAGVSHNQYRQYNVDTQGAVLNNAARITQTQQGHIDGNPNLAGGSARVILNEVTGTSASQLRGYTEVAGTKAEVVIANPNGISCNGCGYINASRGVLTTGSTVLGASGALNGFRATAGSVQIGAQGLAGDNIDQLDLIARSVEVNGVLWGKQLSVITGANEVNYASLGVQLIEGAGVRPTVAIDVARPGAGRMSINAADLHNQRGVITGQGASDITAASLDNTHGRVTAMGTDGLSVTVTGDLTNTGMTAPDGSTLGLIGSNSGATVSTDTVRNSSAARQAEVRSQTMADRDGELGAGVAEHHYRDRVERRGADGAAGGGRGKAGGEWGD